MRNFAKFGCALLIAALGGCAIQPIDPSKPASVGSITVDPQISWASIKVPTGPTWTVDGLGLNELHFYPDIESGRPLVSSASSDQMPKYDASMLPDDVAELFTGTLGRTGYRQVHATALTPQQFGADTGFTFQLAFTTPDGLEMKGLVLADQHAKELDAILFLAPGEYYFDHYSATVSKLLASARRNE